MTTTITGPGTIGTAVVSADGRYRYELTRMWNRDLPVCTWVMLNPSTADADIDDPTIRRCISFSRLWGYGSLTVVNLFALRATNPLQLVEHPDPFGPDNVLHLTRAVAQADLVMAAWGGSVPIAHLAYTADIRGNLARVDKTHCLGLTKSRQPRHPLYVKGTTTPVRL